MPRLPPEDPYINDADFGTRGPLPGANADSDEEYERLNIALLGNPYLFWVEGVVGIGNAPWDDEDGGARILADQATHILKQIGLTPSRSFWNGTSDPNDTPRRRQFTAKRVSVLDAEMAVYNLPGLSRDTLCDVLFKEGNWTPETLKAARAKTNTMIHKLWRMHPQVIDKRYDRDGTLRIFPVNTPNRMATRPSGVTFAVPPPANELTIDELTEVARQLIKAIGHYMNPKISHDVSVLRDYLREAILAARPPKGAPK